VLQLHNYLHCVTYNYTQVGFTTCCSDKCYFCCCCCCYHSDVNNNNGNLLLVHYFTTSQAVMSWNIVPNLSFHYYYYYYESLRLDRPRKGNYVQIPPAQARGNLSANLTLWDILLSTAALTDKGLILPSIFIRRAHCTCNDNVVFWSMSQLLMLVLNQFASDLQYVTPRFGVSYIDWVVGHLLMYYLYWVRLHTTSSRTEHWRDLFCLPYKAISPVINLTNYVCLTDFTCAS